MIVFPHVPKTGGSSIRRALCAQLGPRLLLDYGTPPARPERVSAFTYATRPLFLGLRQKRLGESYDVVYGHFSAGMYRFVRAPVAMFFRDPVHRLISEYHYHRSRGRHTDMSLEEFASSNRRQNLYSIFLGGRRIEDIAFVGITERFSDSLILFERVFGLRLEEHRELTGRYDPDSYEARSVRQTQARNQIVYDAARRRFDELCRQYL